MEDEVMSNDSPGAVAKTTAEAARIVPRWHPGRKSRALVAAILLTAIGSVAHASTPLYGVSACTLVEGVPSPTHPLRKHPALRSALVALQQAGTDKKKNATALGRFDAFLDPLYKQAEVAFARPRYDKDKETYDAFTPGPARAFLERWVLAVNAPLKVGLERFEPVSELTAAMTLAACRADNRSRAIALSRAATGPETRALSAFAALLLLEDRNVDEARELVRRFEGGAGTTGDEGFVAPLVLAELASDGAERARLHEVAGRRIQNPDQEAAWRAQARRFAAEPPKGTP